LTLPFQIWAAVRFGVRGATASNAFVVLMAVAASATASGFLGRGDTSADTVLALQFVVGSTVMATLGLAALFSDGRRAEQRAREAETLLRDAIESIGEGFAIFDAQDRLVMTNQQFRALYSRIADLVVPGIAYEQLLRAAARRGQFAGAIDQPDEWVADSLRRHLNPSGEVELQLCDGRWVLVRERRTGDGGTVGLRADVTRLKQQEAALRDSEERYRRLVEATPDAVLVHQNGEIILANSACLALFGATRTDQIIGKSPLQFLHPDERAVPDGQVRSLIKLEKPLALSARKVLRLDGSVADVDITATPLVDEGRSTALVILRDVTDRKAAEEQLRSAQKMEALGQLTGGVAHDFNNLLMVIIGNLELASEHLGADAQLQRQIGMALAAAERGAGLTHRLLAFARRQALQPERLDLNQLVDELTELLHLTLSEKIEIDIVTQPGLWAAVADRVQVENALVNLAVNARDAMPAGGRLTIETANAHLDADYAYRNADAMPGDYVMLEVSDTGTGMPSEIIARAFDPFFTTKDVGKGSGLGLSVIYGFAKQSGGHLKIYSQVGHGTAVRLYLPRAATDERGATQTRTPSAQMPEGAETILVVEDDPAVRDVTVARLLDLGYHVLEAPNGGAARRILADGTPIDLLFTDVVMPGALNGIELADESRRLVPGLKVLLTSGYPAHAPANHGEVELGSEFLPKPYQKHELARKVREVLDAEPARRIAGR
ncbi:MAG: PAS domain S-box protein, partial [Dongiaceae bacterium]